ncbi:hypothetical protein ABIE09_004074 [Lysobacter enzymogenes]|uniref:hypothetical protein n=1 Tax=Lysobacter enzymogenes TaxID=69 RepID=UPI00339A9A00
MSYERKLMVVTDLDDHPQLMTYVEQWIGDGVDYVAFVGRHSYALHDRFLDACVLLALRDGCEGSYSILASWHPQDGNEEALSLMSRLRPVSSAPMCLLHF